MTVSGTGIRVSWQEHQDDLVAEYKGSVYRLRGKEHETCTLLKDGSPIARGGRTACMEFFRKLVEKNGDSVLSGSPPSVESEGNKPHEGHADREKEKPMHVKLDKNRIQGLFKALGYDDADSWNLNQVEDAVRDLPTWVEEDKIQPPTDTDDQRLFDEILIANEKGDQIVIVAKKDARGGNTRAQNGTNGTHAHGSDWVPDAQGNVPEEETTRGRPRKEREPSPTPDFVFEEPEKPKCLKVTLALAKMVRDAEWFPQDRHISETRKEKLRTEIREGRFYGAEWSLCDVEETGKTYRINGKHTSLVLSELLEARENIPDITVTVRKFRTKTMKDAAGLFSLMDNKDAVRTKGDVLRGYAGIDTEASSLTPRQLSTVTAGLAFEKWGAKYRRVPTQVQATLLLESHGFVAWVKNMLTVTSKDNPKKHVLRMAVIAAMHRTWAKDPEVATAFWGKVCNDSEDPTHSPVRVLFRWLGENKVGAREGKSRVSENEVMYRCIQAWNAYRDNDKELVIKTNQYKPDKALPEVL